MRRRPSSSKNKEIETFSSSNLLRTNYGEGIFNKDVILIVPTKEEMGTDYFYKAHGVVVEE